VTDGTKVYVSRRPLPTTPLAHTHTQQPPSNTQTQLVHATTSSCKPGASVHALTFNEPSSKSHALLAVVAGSMVSVYQLPRSAKADTQSGGLHNNGPPNVLASPTNTHHVGAEGLHCNSSSSSSSSSSNTPVLVGELNSAQGAKFRSVAWHPQIPHVIALATQV